MQIQPSPMVSNGPPLQVTEPNYPKCHAAGIIPISNCEASYVYSALFEQRFNHARRVMDVALGSLLNLHPPTLRTSATLLGQLKLIELVDYLKFFSHGSAVGTMAVSNTKLLFHPDLVLYFANVLNPSTDEQEITRRRKRMTTMLVHEAMHYVQGDTQACDPYRISLADQPDKVNLIMSMSNLIFDAIHDEGMADTVSKSRFSQTGDRDLPQYLDEQMIRDHAGDMRGEIERILQEMDADPSEISNFLKMLKAQSMDKQTALGKCVTVMAGSGNWNNKPPPPPTNPGPTRDNPDTPDTGDDDQDSDGDGQDDSDDDGTESGNTGSNPDDGKPDGKPTGGLSEKSQDTLNQNNHVVADPIENLQDDQGNDVPDPRTPADKAREQIENEQSEAETNRHKAMAMAGDETGLFDIKAKPDTPKRIVDWRTILMGALRAVLRKGSKPSFRKYRQEEALRGIYMPIKEDQQAHAAGIFDVSASFLCRPEQMGRCVYTIAQAVMQCGLDQITILPFDGGAHEPVAITKQNVHKIRREGLDMGGGGGTMLEPTLVECLEYIKQGKFPKMNKNSCLMIATDAELRAPHPDFLRKLGMGSVIYLVPAEEGKASNLNSYARMFCDAVTEPSYVKRTGAKARVIFIH